MLVAVYVVAVGLLGALFQHRGLLRGILATGLVALLARSVHQRLQAAANRLLFGDRDNPYAVLSRLSTRLTETAAPNAVLGVVVETVAQALRLPYAGIEIYRGGSCEAAAGYGQPTEHPVRFPIVYQTEIVGALVLGPRSAREGFRAADERVLAELARHTGATALAARLTADLQRSRQRLVTAQEEERRRLQRNLHDGLGPALAGIGLGIEATRNRVVANPSAQVLLDRLSSEVQTVIADLRRLVYDLRPPALDQLGLASALREYAAGLASRSASPAPAPSALAVTIDIPDELPPLPAAVEVATYRIATEALANVTRHADARHCLLRLRIDQTLQLTIIDDGVGLPTEHGTGIGLTSMHERTQELGGSCQVERTATGGTWVVAWLPLPADKNIP